MSQHLDMLAKDRSSMVFPSDQAMQQNVLREMYKQFELLLLKKKAGEHQKVTIRQGLLVSIPQVEKVSSMSGSQVTHALEVMAKVLVRISGNNNLQPVCDVLIKMCDTYLDDPYNMVSSNDKKGKPDLPSYAKDDVESDLEVVVPYTQSDALSSYAATPASSASATPQTTLTSSTSTASLASLLSEEEQQQQQQQTVVILTTTVQQPLQAMNSYRQVTEDSPLYHLLNTLYLILDSHRPLDPAANSQLATLPPKIITFFFNLLQYTFTPAIRYRAATCLHVISTVSLDVIAQLFVTRLHANKSDDYVREYSAIQRASKFLAFGFATPSQADASGLYFAKMLIEMEKCSRAVFMQAICFTIMRAFPRMFASPAPTTFIPVLTKMYDTVLKWTKKSKLKPLAIRTLVVMCGATEEMMLARGSDLLALIGGAMKESRAKRPYLEALVSYFGAVKALFGSEARAPWYSAQVENVLPYVLPRKASPSDPALALEVLLAMGRFSLSIVVSKYLVGVLQVSRTPEYTPEAKAVVLALLAALSTEQTEGMRAYDRTLWAMLDSIFAAYDGDTTHMRYVLLNFPALCSPEYLKDVGDKVTKWTWHADPEIATMSTVGIMRYLAAAPHATFPGILFQMLTYITNYFGEMAGLIKVVRNLCMVIEEFIALHYLPNGDRKMDANIEASAWRGLRETCEGVALFLLSSTIPALWTQVYEFLRLTGHEIFREIDGDDTFPYLADYLPHSSFLAVSPPHITNDVSHSSFASLIPTLNQDLAYFLQIHNGNLHNSVNWAWTRLRKRWHPKSQPIGWKNNLAFLLLSLRLNYEMPEVTAVEDQLLTEVLTCYFQEREGRTGEELGHMVSELSLYLHPSCYDTVFRFVEQERGRDLKKKKKEVFYTQEYVIVYLGQLVARLNVADFDGLPSARTALREVTYFWITNNSTFHGVPAITKNHSAKLFRNFLQLDSSSSIPKGEVVSLNKASYTKLIFQCLQSLSENAITNADSIEGELELNIQKAFNILVAHGNLDDFKNDIVPYLVRCLGLGHHIHALIAETLALLLRRSPKFLNQYIEGSFDNERNPMPSLSFLRALVINFTEYYSDWPHNCPPERLVHLCLFHLGSSNAEARKLATTLSNKMMTTNGQTAAEDETIVPTLLSPHLETITSDHVPIYVYNRMALLYSNSMSSKYQWMTPGLFEEADQCFQHLPLNHKQLLLTLLAPWTRNFFWIVAGGGDGVSAKSIETVLESLSSITMQARTNPNMHNALEVLWGELSSSGDSSGQTATYNVYKKTIEFLKEKYHSEKHPVESRATSKMIVSFIAHRSSMHWAVVVEYLMKYLRHFQQLPPSPATFVQEFLAVSEGTTTSKEEISSPRSEEAFMAFFEDLAFEFQHQDVMAVPRLVPTLLVNALLVHGPASHDRAPVATTSGGVSVPPPPRSVISAKRIVDNMLLALVVQQPTIADEVKSEALALIASDWSQWTTRERTMLISIIQTSMGDSIAEMWEQLVLQCAIRAGDVAVSLAAFEWYEGIRITIGTRKDGMDGLLGLCCGLWRSAIMSDVERMYKSVGVLSAIVANGARCIQSDTAYSIIIRLGSILLHTSYLAQFNAALILLNRTIASLASNPPLQAKITEEMIDILGAGMRPEQVVNRGISHPATALLTLWFAKECAAFWERKSRAQSTSIMTTVVLAASCMAVMAPDDPLTVDFLEYITESPSPPVAKLYSTLLAPYHLYVVRTTSSPPCTPAELVAALVSSFTEMFGASPELLSNLVRAVTEMVKSLMDSRREADASFLLSFIDSMISSLGVSPSLSIQPAYLVEFITVVIDVCQRSSSSNTREQAQSLIPFIMNNLPPSVPIGVFDFIKPFTNGFESSVSSMFGFQTDADSLMNLYTSLYLINTYIFAVPSDSAANVQMKRVLETHNQKDKVAKHLPTITSPFTPTIKRRAVVPASRPTPTIISETSRANLFTPPAANPTPAPTPVVSTPPPSKPIPQPTPVVSTPTVQSPPPPVQQSTQAPALPPKAKSVPLKPAPPQPSLSSSQTAPPVQSTPPSKPIPQPTPVMADPPVSPPSKPIPQPTMAATSPPPPSKPIPQPTVVSSPPPQQQPVQSPPPPSKPIPQPVMAATSPPPPSKPIPQPTVSSPPVLSPPPPSKPIPQQTPISQAPPLKSAPSVPLKPSQSPPAYSSPPTTTPIPPTKPTGSGFFKKPPPPLVKRTSEVNVVEAPASVVVSASTPPFSPPMASQPVTTSTSAPVVVAAPPGRPPPQPTTPPGTLHKRTPSSQSALPPTPPTPAGVTMVTSPPTPTFVAGSGAPPAIPPKRLKPGMMMMNNNTTGSDMAQ
eukprot:gene7038-8183_t